VSRGYTYHIEVPGASRRCPWGVPQEKKIFEGGVQSSTYPSVGGFRPRPGVLWCARNARSMPACPPLLRWHASCMPPHPPPPPVDLARMLHASIRTGGWHGSCTPCNWRANYGGLADVASEWRRRVGTVLACVLFWRAKWAWYAILAGSTIYNPYNFETFCFITRPL
jgi:hypothetical protein